MHGNGPQIIPPQDLQRKQTLPAIDDFHLSVIERVIRELKAECDNNQTSGIDNSLGYNDENDYGGGSCLLGEDELTELKEKWKKKHQQACQKAKNDLE